MEYFWHLIVTKWHKIVKNSIAINFSHILILIKGWKFFQAIIYYSFILHLPHPFVKPLTEKCLLTAWYRKPTARIQMWEARGTRTLNWILLKFKTTGNIFSYKNELFLLSWTLMCHISIMQFLHADHKHMIFLHG